MNSISTGQFIREQRKKLNLSQAKLAEMLFVEPQTVSKWERGLGMPDYDNIDRLKEIFGCSLSEILEPSFDEETLDSNKTENITATDTVAINEAIKENADGKEEEIKASDYLNKEKIKNKVEMLFGYEYVDVYTDRFLFKDIRRKRSKEELETTLTQGMFKNKSGHSIIGLEAPWLYARLFLFLLACSLIAFVPAIFGSIMPFVVIGSLLSALPLLMFLFESNFARNLSLIDVLKMFIIGGLGSITLTSVFSLSIDNKIVEAVILAPIFEEIFKAIVAVVFISRIKPTNLLTGVLIGFSVGAGFSFFENLHYGFAFAIEGLIYDEPIIAVLDVLMRSICDFFVGHHYWTGIFSAIYVLSKKKTEFNFKELFQFDVIITLLFCMILHAMWNGSGYIDIRIVSLILEIISSMISVGMLIVFINVGIAQTKVMGIIQDYNSERSESTEEEQSTTEQADKVAEESAVTETTEEIETDLAKFEEDKKGETATVEG